MNFNATLENVINSTLEDPSEEVIDEVIDSITKVGASKVSDLSDIEEKDILSPNLKILQARKIIRAFRSFEGMFIIIYVKLCYTVLFLLHIQLYCCSIDSYFL